MNRPMTLRSLMTALTLAAAALVTACSSLPPAQVATDTKVLVGKWEGYAVLKGGHSREATLQVFDDGSFVSSVSGWPDSRGTVKVADGKYRYHSETRNIGGTFTLHEGGGERVLVGLSDDGHSGEYRPGK